MRRNPFFLTTEVQTKFNQDEWKVPKASRVLCKLESFV